MKFAELIRGNTFKFNCNFKKEWGLACTKCNKLDLCDLIIKEINKAKELNLHSK